MIILIIQTCQSSNNWYTFSSCISIYATDFVVARKSDVKYDADFLKIREKACF